MKWRFQSAQEALACEAASWDTLNREIFRSHPLLDTRFLWPLVRHFGSEKTELATLDDTGRTRGALLLNSKSPGIWRSFLPSQAQIAPVVLPPERVGTLFALMRQLPSHCWLLEMMRQDRSYSCFRAGLPEGAEEDFHARTMRVNLDTTFESYWQARPKGLRKHLRKYLKSVSDLDRPIAFRLWESPSEVVAGLKRYGDLEVRGWKGASGTAVHADNAQGRFYAEVLEDFARSGHAYVYELYFGDRLAASRLCIASDDMLVILKTTYDETLARFAPGRLLLYELLQSEFQRTRHQVIEFYTNASNATLAWASESRNVSHITLFRDPWIRRGFVFLSRSKRALKEAPAAVANLGRGDKARTRQEDAELDEFRVDLVTTRTGFEGLRDDWQRIYALDGYSSIFLTYVWFENFIKEVVEEPRIAIFVVRSKRDAVAEALFPMMWVERSVFGLASRGLMALSNFYSPVAKPIFGTRKQRGRVALVRALLRHLREHSANWVTIDFNMLPRETCDFEVVQEALRAERLRHTRYFGSANWILPASGLTGVGDASRAS